MCIFNVFKQGRQGRTLKSSLCSRGAGGVSWKPQQQLLLVLRQPGISPSQSCSAHLLEKERGKCSQMGKITSRSCFCTRSHSSCWEGPTQIRAMQGGSSGLTFGSAARWDFPPANVLQQPNPTFYVTKWGIYSFPALFPPSESSSSRNPSHVIRQILHY